MKKATKPAKKAAKIASVSKVLVNVVLDKSGSMVSCMMDTIGGFNTYIDELRKDKKASYSLSLTLFDTVYENRHVGVDIAEVPHLTNSTYVPGGNTALYDAIGKTIAAVDGSGVKYDKVLTVIMTDGEENSSREFTLARIRELIIKKEALGNWTFVFLGADLSAFGVGDAMGVSLANSIAYNQKNVAATMGNLAAATVCFSASNVGQTADLMKSVEHTVAYRSSGMNRRAY